MLWVVPAPNALLATGVARRGCCCAAAQMPAGLAVATCRTGGVLLVAAAAGAPHTHTPHYVNRRRTMAHTQLRHTTRRHQRTESGRALEALKLTMR